MRAQNYLLVAALATGCAGTATTTSGPPGGIVRTYREGSAGGHANVYWFETPAGSVLVDVPLTISEMKKEKGSMVRPYRIYITSSKAERFGSLGTAREGDVPAYTTPAVATEIQSYGASRLAAARRAHGDDVAASVVPPTPAVEERTHDMVGEVEVELLPLGPAESEASMALFLPKSGELITGDVVAGHEHLDLTWGRSVVWQDRINELKALEPKWIYPGHGASQGPELLDEMLVYLKFFHDTVASRVKQGAPARISANDALQIKQIMSAKFPKWGREEVLDKSIAGEYAVQLAALPPAPTAEPAIGGGPATSAPPAAATAAPAPAPAAPAPAPAPATVKSSSSDSIDDLLGDDNKGKKKKKKKGAATETPGE